MRVISLWQPWASLVVHGFKHFETRHWDTAYRGPLLIHAAKKKTAALRALMEFADFRDALNLVYLSYDDLPRGGIIGRVELIATFATVAPSVQDYLAANPSERSFGNFIPPRFAWELTEAIAFSPAIPCTGRQGFFDYDERKIW